VLQFWHLGCHTENHITSNAEYTNTQQGLPDIWVYLAHN
jgi:hypothetical protein